MGDYGFFKEPKPKLGYLKRYILLGQWEIQFPQAQIAIFLKVYKRRQILSPTNCSVIVNQGQFTKHVEEIRAHVSGGARGAMAPPLFQNLLNRSTEFGNFQNIYISSGPLKIPISKSYITWALVFGSGRWSAAARPAVRFFKQSRPLSTFLGQFSSNFFKAIFDQSIKSPYKSCFQKILGKICHLVQMVFWSDCPLLPNRLQPQAVSPLAE